VADRPVQRALDSVSDAVDVDWKALESDAADEETVRTLRALEEIAAISRAHDRPAHEETLEVPFSWGPLHVRTLLAHGAHGDVYRAWDPRLEREVALKLLRLDAGDDEESLAIDEGRLLARVRHLNVVTVYGADRIGGRAGIWMELVEGSTLHSLVESHGPVRPDDAIQIGVAISSGLTAIHAAGLIHRDVKAQNVVREPGGRTILMDLGAGMDRANPDSRVEGTPVYVAPVVVEGKGNTVAADIYAVGVLLFFLLTARYPVIAASLDDLRRRHRSSKRERLAANPSVPDALSAVVDKALSERPEDRYHSADDMRAALESINSPRERRRRLSAGVVLVLAATLIGAIAVPWTRRASDVSANPSDIITQTVRLPNYLMGVPSHDGRFLPYVDDDGNLHVWEVATGRSREIVSAEARSRVGESPAMSPDGDRVAYRSQLADGGNELLVVNADGRWPHVVIARQTAFAPMPLDWSEDGRTILCVLAQRDRSSDLVLVPVDGRRPTLLRSFPAGVTIDARLSPDGQFVAVAARGRSQPDSRLFLLGTLGPTELIPIDGTENAESPRWFPDGRRLFFVRALEESTAHGWVVAVENGTGREAPVLAMRDVGFTLQTAVTRHGAIYRVAGRRAADIYVVPFDPTGAAPPGPPTRVSTTRIGDRVGPSWSPDGRFIAYFETEPVEIPGRNPLRKLMIQELTTGNVRHIPVPLVFLGGYTPRWSPDGTSVTVWGRNGERIEDFGYFRVDVVSAATTEVVNLGINAPAYIQYSPDGRNFWYVDPRRGLIARDVATGTEDVVVPVSRGSRPSRFFLSPDGRSIALLRVDDEASSAVLEVRGRQGRPRALVRTNAGTALDFHGWTPDGQALLYSQGSRSPLPLWRISVHGGPPMDMRLPWTQTPNVMSVSPDGDRIAYTENTFLTELLITSLPPTDASR